MPGPAEQRPAAPQLVVLDNERAVWLTALYEANVRMVVKVCQRYLENPEDAADATHEVFLRAAASLHTAPDSKDARAWLTTVTRNYCLDLLRRRRVMASALTELGAAAVVPIEAESAVDDRQLAEAVLEQLAVRDRQALWESHVEDRPVAEIAERFGLSYRATAQLLSRARRRAAVVAAELVAALIALRWAVARRGRTLLQQSTMHPVAMVVALPALAAAVVTVVVVAGHPKPHHPQPTALVRTSPPPPAAQPSASPPLVALAPPAQHATTPNTGLPPPAPVASAPAAPKPSTPPQPVAVVLPSPPPRIVPTPTPAPKPSGPPWKKGHHKLRHHGHGHSAS